MDEFEHDENKLEEQQSEYQAGEQQPIEGGGEDRLEGSQDDLQQSEAQPAAESAEKKPAGAHSKMKYGMIAGVAVLVGVVGFLGGSAYTARQQAEKSAAELRAAIDQKEQLEKKLKAAEKQAEDQGDDTEAAVPQEQQTATQTTPPKTTENKTTQNTTTTKDKTKTYAAITQAQPVVSASTVTFTIQLPKAYGTNGYCKVLVKRDGDGAYAIERQVNLSGTSSCTITVNKSDLQAGVTNWQVYAMFEDYDSKTYSGWQDRKTFTL